MQRLADDVPPTERNEGFEAMLAAVVRTDHLVNEARAARHSARRKRHFAEKKRRRRWWKGKGHAD